MLRKLRLKFILINMGIVTVILSFIIGFIYFSTSRTLERESIQLMETVVKNPVLSSIPGRLTEGIRVPYFTVERSLTGDIVNLSGGFYDLSDMETIREIVSEADKTDEQTGVLKAYNLRFLRRDTPLGERIVFADMSSERSTISNIVRNLTLTGGGAFVCFLVISILLARWAVKPVEKAWVQQKQFVADASHELKTPLTVIMTDAELLNSPDCPEEDRAKLAGGIVSMSEQMRGLVENLLELARIDNGSVKGEIKEQNFSEIVMNEAMTFEPVFFEKEMPFSYETDENITIKGNGTHLKQVVDVFLDNASKYAAPGGGVRIELKRTSAKKCLLQVSNQGEEIPAEDLKNLFKRFYRADKVRTMNHSYGLGLSIAQSIVEEHSGRVWAESKDGYNSFFAELPCVSGGTTAS